MITPEEAANKVMTTQGYEQVLAVKDYDAQHYVVEALPKKNKLPHGAQTTFGVDKATGQVTAFHLQPGSTLERYLSAKRCDF